MLKDQAQLEAYVKDNYPDVTDHRLDEDHFDIYCQQCKVVRGFQVVRRVYTNETTQYRQYDKDFDAPRTIYFHCPVCDSYKMWIVFRISEEVTNEDGSSGTVERIYRVTSIPSEGIEDIAELPPKPPALRTAYRQAIRAMDANAHIAAAAMFRRALQVITREILGAHPSNLANELQEVIGKKYNGVVLTTDFSDRGYIVKEVGNQGAHPDADPDLLDFTEQDAGDLRDIFMEIVMELFVLPEAKKRAREEFLARRKIR